MNYIDWRQVVDRYRERSRYPDNKHELFLTTSEALGFREELIQAGVAIIGIEGYKVENNQISPTADEIFNHSRQRHSDLKTWSAFQQASAQRSKEFVERVVPSSHANMWCIVWMDESCWQLP